MDAKRKFLRAALAAGIECRTITPDDVLRHLTPEVLAEHLPVALRAKLIATALRADKLSPSLLVETVSVQDLAEHMPEHLLWRCVAVAAERGLGSQGARGTPRSGAGGKPRGSAAPAAVLRGSTSDRMARASTVRRPNVSRRPGVSTGSGPTSMPGVEAVPRGASYGHAAPDRATPERTPPDPADVGDSWRLPTTPAGEAPAAGSGDAFGDWNDEHTIAGAGAGVVAGDHDGSHER